MTMDFKRCIFCRAEIEGEGIPFRGRLFCGDECCEQFAARFVDKVEPDLTDLAGLDLGEGELDDDTLVDDALLVDDGLLDDVLLVDGIGLDDDEDAVRPDDDDYDIDPDDF